MGVEVIFRCGGCSATAPGKEPLKREFRSFSGRSWGVGGSINVNYVDDVAPDGWVAYDPYTYCTYCPKCWEEIMKDHEQGDADDE